MGCARNLGFEKIGCSGVLFDVHNGPLEIEHSDCHAFMFRATQKREESEGRWRGG